MAFRGWLVVVSSLSLSLGACIKKAPPPPAPAAAPAPQPPAEPLPPMGMTDPFARLTGDAAKSLKAGYKAMRAKDYDAARAAFAAVVSAFPDYSPARLQELKAAALGGHTADVPALWKELLVRDDVAFAGRLDKPKELAPLRAAPEWPRLEALETSVRPAYAAGLAQAILFVGRQRDPAVKGDEDTAKIDLSQEIYAVDPSLARYRRLTDTDGHLFAFSASPGQKAVSFLVVTAVAGPTGAAPEFLDPGVGFDRSRPRSRRPVPSPSGRPAPAPRPSCSAGPDRASRSGSVRPGNGGAEASYALDATRTAVVSVPVSGAIPTNRTVASPAAVITQGETETAAQVTMSDDRKSLQIADADRTLRATRALAPDSLHWSPSGQRLVYAGAFDDCGARRRGEQDRQERALPLGEGDEGSRAHRHGAVRVSRPLARRRAPRLPGGRWQTVPDPPAGRGDQGRHDAQGARRRRVRGLRCPLLSGYGGRGARRRGQRRRGVAPTCPPAAGRARARRLSGRRMCAYQRM